MHPRTTSDPLRHPREHRGIAVTALERRISELEQLASSQGHELRIQFERIAQLQADWDVLRIRFSRSCSQQSTVDTTSNGPRPRRLA